MKGAQADKISPGFFELHVTANDFNHIGACNQFLNKTLWDGHVGIVGTGSSSLALGLGVSQSATWFELV